MFRAPSTSAVKLLRPLAVGAQPQASCLPRQALPASASSSSSSSSRFPLSAAAFSTSRSRLAEQRLPGTKERDEAVDELPAEELAASDATTEDSSPNVLSDGVLPGSRTDADTQTGSADAPEQEFSSRFSGGRFSALLPGMSRNTRRAGSLFPTNADAGVSDRLSIRHYFLNIKCSRNNTIISFTDPAGNPLATMSSGKAGFKKSARSGYEAAYTSASRVFATIRQNRREWSKREIKTPVVGPKSHLDGISIPLSSIHLRWRGFGNGREAVQKAMLSSEGDGVREMVVLISDHSPLKVGGVRGKKQRNY